MAEGVDVATDRPPATEPPETLWLDSSGRVALEKMRCHRCGYNLRGLAADGVCTECGRPVRDSPPLYLQPTGWLKRLRLGAVLVCCAGLLFGGVAVFENTVGQATLHMPERVGETTEIGSRRIEDLWWLVALGVLGAGVILAAAPHPSARQELRGRTFLRACYGLLLVVAVIGTVWNPVDDSPWLIVPPIATLATFLMVGTRYMGNVFALVPSRFRSGWAAVHMWLTLLPLAFFVALIVYSWMQAPKYPYASPVWLYGGTAANDSEYFVWENSEKVTRTTTVPASYLSAPNSNSPSRSIDALLERYFSYAIIVCVAWVIDLFVLIVVVVWTLHAAVCRRVRAEAAARTATAASHYPLS